MTAQQPEVPISLARPDFPAPTTQDVSTRLLGSARSLFLHGLVVLAAAMLLGIAESVSLWLGALLVALGMLMLAGIAAVTGIVSHWWS